MGHDSFDIDPLGLVQFKHPIQQVHGFRAQISELIFQSGIGTPYVLQNKNSTGGHAGLKNGAAVLRVREGGSVPTRGGAGGQEGQEGQEKGIADS